MTFARIDRQSISLTGPEPRVITPVRDELALLPHFLRHHRQLGLAHFIMIDNGSVDGTTQYLLEQPDCAVFYTEESFRDAAFGMDWVNRILADERYEGWLIYLDADEHLAYRAMESTPIAAFLAHLGEEGADTVFGAMIDMYPDGDFLGLRVTGDGPLHASMPWFDADYVFRPWPRRPWDPPTTEFRLQVLGGPRCRLLSRLKIERRRGFVHYTIANQVDRFVDAAPLAWMPVIARVWPVEMPAQHKKPINYVRPGFRYTNSHSCTNAALAGETVALLHFKFCHELQQRVRMAATEGNHYRRGLSYHQLDAGLRRWGDRPLTYPGSRRYGSSADLERLGLIGSAVAALWQGGAREVVTTAERADARHA
ncbi:MAG TPA: glycosyltransferase family 2 protein [Caulobacteraceae bacterium]